MAQARRTPRRRVRLDVSRLTFRPFGGFLGPNSAAATQSLAALGFLALSSVVAGLTLASQEEQFDSLPGLLLFIPAAIGLRGNVFGPLGSRLSTAIQTGTFSWTLRRDSVLGQNLIAVVVNSLAAGLALAVLAEILVIVLRTDSVAPIGFSDFVIISVLGGMMASAVVLVLTLAITFAAVRLDWDLDNVVAPLVTAGGDLITIPALLASTVLIRKENNTVIVAAVVAIVCIVAVLMLLRSSLETATRIVVESLPILIAAGLLSLLAGLAIEGAEERLSWTLLVLLPGYLGAAGALGGILVNRLSSKVHLGLVEPTPIPSGEARPDMGFTLALAAPIFLFLAVLAKGVAELAGQPSPSLLALLAAVLSGGLVATFFVIAVAYYGTLLVVRFGLDPDNTGIPLVTASMDVIGAVTLIGAVVLWGVA